MADEVERVEYVFEGDVSSLRTASQTAIEMLNKYSDTMKKASSTDAFTASQRSTKSMQASINRLTKDVSKMQEKLKSVGDVKLPTGSSTSKAMTDTLKTLNSQMVQLSGVDTVTTKTLTGFRTELEGIRSRLQENSTQVDRLVASEQRFQTTLEAVQSRANSFRDTMTSMKSQLSGAFDPVANKLRTFSATFDGVGAKVQAFKDKATTSFGKVSQLASAVASAFRRVSQDTDTADSTADRLARTHGVLSSSLSKLTSIFKRETTEIQNEKGKLKSKESTLKETTSLHSKLSQTLKNLGNSFTRESRNASVFGRSMKSLGASSGILKKAFQTLTGIQIADWLAQGTKSAIDYIENLNLFNVAMGESAEVGHAFVKQMQEVYGMDPSNLYRYAGYFYQLTDAIGMSDKASSVLSLSLTKASNDIASLFNVPIEQVVDNLASGMQGMSRAVRKYGMDIRATTLQETAATYGLTQQVETMSEANRMALRYITMMNQVSNALHQVTTDEKGATIVLGDFAATIETPANQLRIFKEQMSQLGRAIGNFFVRPLGVAIAYVNGFVMALRTVLNFIAQTIGILKGSISKVDTSGTDKAAKSIAGIGSAASDTAKKLKGITTSFDELNILQDNTDTGGGGVGGGGVNSDDVIDPALEDAIAGMELKIENIKTKANELRDSLLEFFGFSVDAGEIIKWDPSQFENNLINKFPEWTETIEASFDHWGEIVQGFKSVFNSMGVVIDEVKDKLLDFFGQFINDKSVSSFIEELGPRLEKISSYIREHASAIANIIIILGTLTAVLPVVTSIISHVGTALKTIHSIVGTTSKILVSLGKSFNILKGFMSPVTAVILILIGIFALAYTQFESVRDAVDTLAEHFKTMAGSIKDAVTSLWTNCLEPIWKNLKDTLQELWQKHLSKLVEQIGLAVTNIVDVIMIVLTALGQVLSFLFATFGPSISNVINTIVSIIGTAVGIISDIISNILRVINGIIDFVVGVFTGDWKRAWNGVVNVFKGVFGLIASILRGVINTCIDLLNGLIGAIWSAVRGIINGVGSVIRTIGKLLGKNNWGWNIGYQPRISHLATGGVITKPTYAMIGEGKYDEAVIPLGDSPQMQDLVEQIASAVRDNKQGSTTDRPLEVHVFLDSREITSAQNRNNRMYGRTIQNV